MSTRNPQVSVVAIHSAAVGASHRCSSERVSDPGSLLAQAPGPVGLPAPSLHVTEKPDMDDPTTDPIDRVNEARLRLVNAEGMLTYCLDGRLSDYEALSGAAALIRDAIRWLDGE